MSKISIGVVFTYIGLFANTLVGFILTPFLIGRLGDSEYAIYQLVASFSGYLTIINIGTGRAMNRFVSMYKAKGENEKVENYISVNLFITTILVTIVALFGIVIRHNIGAWYPKLLDTRHNLELAQELCLLVVINVILNFIVGAFEGLMHAYGHIDKTKIFGVFRQFGRFIAIIIMISLGWGSVSITIVDNALCLLYLIYVLIILKKLCGYRFRIRKFKIDGNLIRENMLFSIASLMGSLSGQLNNNIDKNLLAIFGTEFEITLYTVSTQFYTMFSSISVSLNSVFLNSMTEQMYGKENKKLEDVNIRIGRFLNFVVGCVFWGFLCLGQVFIKAWMGEKYLEVYYYALVVLIPSYIMCLGGVCETVLTAANRMTFVSAVVLVMSVINVIITIPLIQAFGGIGASIGTGIALFISYDVIINCYMHRKIKINMVRTYTDVIKGFFPTQLIVATLEMLICHYIGKMGLNWWTEFILEGMIFVVLYCIGSYVFAFNSYERYYAKSIIGRIIKRKEKV